MKHIEIGLLEFGLTGTDCISPKKMLANVTEYAKKAEQSGFCSLWLSEHHNPGNDTLWLNPEVLIPLLAGATQHIRIGIAGIILTIHQPYRIAYTFKLLSSLFENRIDLGISSGNINGTTKELFFPGTDDNITFEDKLRKLLLIFRSEKQLSEQDIIIPPVGGPVPPVWLLGSSYKKLDLVLNNRVNFSRSIFHLGATLDPEKEQLQRFRDSYFRTHNRFPEITIAFSGCCHKSRSTAKRLAESRKHGFVTNNIVGEPGDFIDNIYSLSELFGVNKFTFLNMAIPQKEKLTGIELISRELNLTGS